ncbi:hypothetical protein SV7mr_32220 [Stieleria bergensis]|uniref:Uncharacterized protein n=1 Tax=Stieleria bergensis TaxID=2528025 RepID=A0A517SX26_9BACT|nr:hypothetical protein SV7mr_32220 [Planctomycetes bacterium SV_7m_r]
MCFSAGLLARFGLPYELSCSGAPFGLPIGYQKVQNTVPLVSFPEWCQASAVSLTAR